MNERSRAGGHWRWNGRPQAFQKDPRADIGVSIAVECPVGNGFRLIASKLGQRHARKAKADSFACLPPRDGLGQAVGGFIELAVHSLLSFLFFGLCLKRKFSSPGCRGRDHTDRCNVVGWLGKSCRCRRLGPG